MLGGLGTYRRHCGGEGDVTGEEEIVSMKYPSTITARINDPERKRGGEPFISMESRLFHSVVLIAKV